MSNDKLAATFHGDPAQARMDDLAMDRTDLLGAITAYYQDRTEQPDLTPEQDLRAAVAERLTDAVHFGDCTDDPCDCLVGRLRWAIDAEQISEAPSETEAAIEMVARHIRAHRLEALYIGDLWEDYPEIGEDKWRAIVDAVSKPAAEQMPDPEAYIAAYDHLTKLAEAWTADNGGAA